MDGSDFTFTPAHESFRSVAARIPGVIAVSHEGETLTYGALDAASGRLARRLRAVGARPEARIALHLDRSPHFAVALLGTLRSGAAFVPLDPAWPADRVARVLRDSGAIACVVSPGQPLPFATSLPVLESTSDNDLDGPEWPGAEEAPVSTQASHLAYVLYTSGSTGEPKGVQIEHGALAAHLASIATVHRIAPDDRCLLFHGIAFDPVIEQLFAPLLCGARVVMRGEPLWNSEECAAFVARHALTVATFPAAYWLQLLRGWQASGVPAGLRTLRQVVVGGEALAPVAVDLWRSLGLTRIRLLNDYGPTEATITATVHELPPEPAPNESAGRIPIGRPHPCMRLHLLDTQGVEVAGGETGEIHLGGPTLARGYLDAEEHTRARFFTHTAADGLRLYRTGDLARFHTDGTLDFLGRVDDQVKIRGHRVELGEVEACLRRLPQVIDAAVVVVDKGDSDKHLAAFVVCAGPGDRDSFELRSGLARTLPQAAVPAEFHFRIRLPVTTNGKVDRAALADSLRQAPLDSSPGEPTDVASSTELLIADTWARALDRAALGVDEDPFLLGATSLTVTRVHEALQLALQRRFSIAGLYELRTPRELAERLEQRQGEAMTSAIARARQQRQAIARRRPTPNSR
jgi:amino acid adenylation domain-containing protein